MHCPNEIERAVHNAILEALRDASTPRRPVSNADRIVADLGFGSRDLTALLARLKGSLQDDEGFVIAELQTVGDLCDAYGRLLAGKRGGSCTGQNAAHPLVGARVDASGEGDAIYETVISLSSYPWLLDHRLGDLVIVPGAAIAELVRATAECHLGCTPEIRGLVFISPIVLQDMRAAEVRVVIAKNRTRVSIHWRPSEASETSWVRCAVAHISRQMGGPPDRVDCEALRTRCDRRADVTSLYNDLAAAGIFYGRAFRCLRELACGAGEALGHVQLPEDQNACGYGIHPALLDAALHVMAGKAPAGRYEAWIPFEVGRFAVYDTDRREALVHAQRIDGFARTLIVDVTVMNLDGTVIALMSSLSLRRAGALTKPDRAHGRPGAADDPPAIENERPRRTNLPVARSFES